MHCPPGPSVPYTRIVEYKHKPNQPKDVYDKPGTCIFKEYSVDVGDPYYPVPNPANQVCPKDEERALISVLRGLCS